MKGKACFLNTRASEDPRKNVAEIGRFPNEKPIVWGYGPGSPGAPPLGAFRVSLEVPALSGWKLRVFLVIRLRNTFCLPYKPNPDQSGPEPGV